ncbi:MAG: S41 family peptidase, partial [Acidobacteriota bacterium]|nr:S41 family peptidase [Acidobacteriota bacterium]
HQYKHYINIKKVQKADHIIMISNKFGYVAIVDAIPGSPAAKAGLGTTDVIETINGVATRDMPLAYAEMLLQGDAGSTVEIGILRFRNPEPTKLTITRAALHYPSVASKMLPEQVGWIKVQSLAENGVKETAAKVEELQRQGAKQLVLDLRHCATGGPREGIALANLFLDKGLITYLQGQKVPRENFDAAAAKDISKLPLVLITNRGTADGAEIAAAALLDDKRAEIVGERTYGDASQRKAITMDDGSAVILSVAKYYSPAGKAIQDTGVTPSVPMVETDSVPDTEDDNAPVIEPQKKSAEDLLLKKAIEVVTKGKTDTASSPTVHTAEKQPTERAPLLPDQTAPTTPPHK